MIIVKPKIGTLFSMGVFIAGALSLAGFCTFLMLDSGKIIWYQFLPAIILGPIALGLLAKTVLGYKKVSIGKDRIEIRFPTRFTTRVHSVKEVESWTENVVKTATGTYKELEVLFQNKGKLNLSYQEHTEYPAVIKYLKKKCGKKFQS